MSFKKIYATELTQNTFQMIGSDWLLVTAEKEGKVNTMTASWGGLGIMWGKPVAFVFIRPQRYTKEFIDNGDTLSLSVLPEDYREQLRYCGTVSGRDEDKIAKAGFTVAHEGETPYFEEANTVLIGRKLYAQPMAPEFFIDKTVDKRWYADKDYHTMYVVELTDILVK